jgi:hypothetical protein
LVLEIGGGVITFFTPYIFTLKNPHNFLARRFALKAEKKDEAIYCNSSGGPNFDDIGVRDAVGKSFTCDFGRCSYVNDTGLDGETFSRVRSFLR